MNRRDFCIKTGMLAGATFISPYLFAESGKPKVVIAKGTYSDDLFDAAIAKLGGQEHFFPNRERVILKPDMKVNALPEEHKTTNPNLVKHITELCYKNRSKGVFVFEHCEDEWTKCYKNSGIERAAKDAHAKVYPGNHPLFFEDIQIEKSKTLKQISAHKQFHDADLLFTVPVFKLDSETTIAGGVKNLMGCINNPEDYYRLGLYQCLAEFLYFKKPELSVIDGANFKEPCLIISNDVLAADAVACELSNINPFDVKHLKNAADLGFGIIDLNQIEKIIIE